MKRKMQRARWLTVTTACVMVTLTIAACGGSSSSSTTSSPTGAASSGASGVLAKANAEVDKLYKGTYVLPEGAAPTPAKAKNMWIISPGQTAQSAFQATTAFDTAARQLGWRATIFDGKFDPSLYLTGIRNAIAAKADGIWLYNIDCAPVKAALQEAKKAGIPVVITQGSDCGTGANALAAHADGYNASFDDSTGVISAKPASFEQWNKSFGATGTWWLVAKSNAKAKVIVFVETDTNATVAIGNGVKTVLKQCSSCKVVDTVNFVGSDLGPALQQKAQQAILQHPEANAIHANYDTAMTSGIAAAIRDSGRKFLVAAGEGFAPNIALLRQGIESTGGGYEPGWEGWSGVDDFVHLFAHKVPRDSGGIGVRLYDIDHNLPPKGKDFTTGLDYQGAYLKSWGVK